MSKNMAKMPENEQERKFPLDKLAANCRELFGVSACTFAGAAYGLSGEFTVAEMREHIENWRRKGAK